MQDTKDDVNIKSGFSVSKIIERITHEINNKDDVWSRHTDYSDHKDTVGP